MFHFYCIVCAHVRAGFPAFESIVVCFVTINFHSFMCRLRDQELSDASQQHQQYCCNWKLITAMWLVAQMCRVQLVELWTQQRPAQVTHSKQLMPSPAILKHTSSTVPTCACSARYSLDGHIMLQEKPSLLTFMKTIYRSVRGLPGQLGKSGHFSTLCFFPFSSSLPSFCPFSRFFGFRRSARNCSIEQLVVV